MNAIRPLRNAIRPLRNAIRLLRNAIRLLRNAIRLLRNAIRLLRYANLLDRDAIEGDLHGRRLGRFYIFCPLPIESGRLKGLRSVWG